MRDTWIILGATSTIARVFARKLAARGVHLVLAGRDMDEIQRSALDYMSRGAETATAVPFDAREPASFENIFDTLRDRDGAINVAVFVGSMPSQGDIDQTPELIAGTVTDSFTGPAEFLTRLAPLLEEKGAGTVVGVGSVAGDRGRLGNYVYGASKAGFHTYLSGLRNRLARSGVHVMTVKPGTVDTAMTWGMDQLPFLAQPEDVANDILRGIEKKRNIIYTPKIWWLVMTVIRSIPEMIFKKLKI